MKKIPSILLVDDDETTNYISKLIINRAELTDELLIALNGKEAIDLLRAKCAASKADEFNRLPSLILLDINMPVMDGFKFLETLQTIDDFNLKSVIIAVLTTSLDPRDIEKVKQFGVNEFLSKPLTKQSLELLLQKHFN